MFAGPAPTEPIMKDRPKFEKMEQVLVPKQILFYNDKTTHHSLAYRINLLKCKDYQDSDYQWVNVELFHDYPHKLNAFVNALHLRTSEN